MNDQDLEIRLRDHYRSIDPVVAPRSLVARIDNALERPAGRRAVFGRMSVLAGLAAVAAVAILAVMIAPGVITGPAAPTSTPAASASLSASPTATPPTTPAPTSTLPGGTMPPISTTNWQNIEIQPVSGIGQPVQVVAWSGGYLALGAAPSSGGSAPAWISGDGRAWASLPGDPFGRVTSIVATPSANGVMVLATAADGTGLAWQSTDGLTWLPIAASGQRNLDTGYVAGNDSGVIVAVESQPAAVERSVDGTSWQTISMPGGGHAQVTGVAASGDGFVAVGHVFAVPDEPTAWWSPDGMTWHRAQVQFRPGDVFVAVQGAADGLVAQSHTFDVVPGTTTDWESQDGGRSWGPLDSPLGTFQGGEGAGSAIGTFVGDGTRLLGYGSGSSGQPVDYWASTGANGWTHLTLTGDTTAAEGGPDLGVYPLLLRDGILFVGPDGAWLGVPWYSG